MSLSDYLLSEIREIAERPTLAEMRERQHEREPAVTKLDSALDSRGTGRAVIVLDASAAVDWLLQNKRWPADRKANLLSKRIPTLPSPS